MNSPVIEVIDLYFSYETTPILEQVNLTIKAGSYTGVIGPNGGGKTTLLKLLMGFLSPKKGTIKLLGKSPKAVRQNIGYVPQIANVDRDFPITVEELVLQGCLSHHRPFTGYPKDDIEKALQAIDLMGLASYRNISFGALSGGIAQRALIARALAVDPYFLFLDEPMANVDTTTKEIILRAISKLKGKKTILLVTHDLNTVISEVESVIAVEKKVETYLPKQVCEHFAMGLYHPPLIKEIKHESD